MTLFLCATFFTACSSQKNDAQPNKDAQKLDDKTLNTESVLDNASEFSEQQLNFQIKKLNSEINYLKDHD